MPGLRSANGFRPGGDGAIVAWHEVPGTSATQKNRPVGNGMIRAGQRTDSMIGVAKFSIRGRHLGREILLGLAAPDHTVPYGTLHSVDDFPGTSCQATIMLSLRDVIDSQRRGFDQVSVG